MRALRLYSKVGVRPPASANSRSVVSYFSRAIGSSLSFVAGVGRWILLRSSCLRISLRLRTPFINFLQRSKPSPGVELLRKIRASPVKFSMRKLQRLWASDFTLSSAKPILRERRSAVVACTSSWSLGSGLPSVIDMQLLPMGPTVVGCRC